MTTAGLRDEAARTFIQGLAGLTDTALLEVLDGLSETVRATLVRQGVAEEDQTLTFQADMRYHGQGFEIPVDLDAADLHGSGRDGLERLSAAFDTEHERLFSFLLDNDHEIVNVRVTSSGPRPTVTAPTLPEGDGDPSSAMQSTNKVWVAGGERDAGVYDRTKLRAGDVIQGPAIVADMDATTVVLPDHTALVHPSGSLLIRPTED